jgi:hypothetical protein
MRALAIALALLFAAFAIGMSVGDDAYQHCKKQVEKAQTIEEAKKGC